MLNSMQKNQYNRKTGLTLHEHEIFCTESLLDL